MQSNEPEPLRSIDEPPIDEPPPDDEPPPRITVRITRISPIAGALTGGITVTVTGAGFQHGAEVYFGDSPSPQVIVLSGNTAQAMLPAATQTGSVDVSLFNPDGNSATLPGGFTYVVTGTGAQAEVLGVTPLAVIEDTESEVIIRGRNLIEAYTNGMLALRGPTRAQVAVSNHTSSRDEATGIEELTFTLRVTAAPQLEPLERMAIQVLASRRPGAASDGVFESSRHMFTVLPRSRPVPLAYSASLDPGKPNLVVVAGRNLEGCTLEFGDGATVHLQRSDDRFVAGIVTVPEGTAATASPQLSVRNAGGDEVAQYAMWIAPDVATAATPTGEATASAAAEPAAGDINLTLTPAPGQQMVAPTEQDSTVFNLNSASTSSLFFDWFNFEITILDLTIVLPIVHEVHLIPFFDGVSADELSDSPVLAQVGRLLRLRGVGLLVALHVDVIIHIRVVLIIGFRFEVWGFGLFNEFPEFGWAIGSIVISIRIEIQIFFILAFLLAAVLPQGRLRVIFSFNLIAELDFTITADGLRLRFGSDFHVEYRRIGPTLNNLLPCGGRFQLASENGQTVFPDAFGGHQSFYFPRAEGGCCVPWDFGLELVRTDPDGFRETVQTSFRADYCLNAAPSPQLGQIIITSENPAPTGFPPTLVMEVEQLALLRALSVPVDASGNPTGEPPQDVRDLGYDVEFFLESPVEVVLDPGSLTQGNAFAIQPGDNVIHARLTPRAAETPRLAFWPGGVLGFAIAGPLAEGREPGVVAGSLPVSVRGEIRVEPALAYEDAQGQLQVTSEIERYEPFEAQREYVLAIKVTVPERGRLPQSLTIKVERAEFARPPLAGAGTTFAHDRHLVKEADRFFIGNLAIKDKQGTIPLSRDMRGDRWIKVPGLTIQPNQQERVGNRGILQLVPPGKQVTGQDVMLSVGLRAEASGAKVTLVGQPLDWTVVNDETFEEYLRGFAEVQAILSGSDATLTKFRDFAKTFYGELSKAPTPTAPTPEFLKGKGEELWNHAYQAVQAAPPAQPLIDDRPIYWVRLQTIAALRSFHRRNRLTLSPTAINQFEWPSRGLDQSDGRIVFPAEAAGFRRAIVTGFDPFELPGSPNTSNPSGLIALALNTKRLGTTQSQVYVRTAIFPVRYREFDEGLIERAVRPSLSSIVMLMTTSQNGSANYYDVERFAGRNRVISTDNENKRPRPLPVSAREYVESTLPYERVITSPETLEGPMGPAPFVIDQSYVVAGDPGIRTVNRKPNPDPPASREMARPGDFRPEPLLDDVDKAAFTKFPNERPDPTKISREGSGGSYLSNEIFYRTALLRDTERPPLPGENQSPLAAGHFHIPGTGRQPRVVGEALIRGVRTAVERFLANLFRMRAAQNVTFPQTNINTASAPITLSATNITNETINAFTVDVSPPFWVNWPGPTPIPLSPGSTLPLPFTFRPTTPGVHTANIRLLDRNGEVLLTATFTGEGLPVYSIAGQVTVGGVPLQGVQVTLSGSRTTSVSTGKDGRYSFTNLDAGGNYTITPSKANYTFTPPSRSFSGLASNQTADFTATHNRRRISGRVRTAGGVAIPGAIVMLSWQGRPNPEGDLTIETLVGMMETNATGEYLFADLKEGDTYTVTISRGNYTFTPEVQVFVLDVDVDFDITGTPVNYRISGHVGLGGVTVNLSGSQTAAATTDTSGNYSFAVPAEGSYTITPSKTHYTFTPPSLSFNNLAGDRMGDFAATLNRYGISGRVTREDGGALAGATIALAGTRTATTVSDDNGAYSFAGLPAGGSYTVTVSRANYSFAQPSRTFNDLASTQTADFTGALLNYTVSGRVTSGGLDLGGVAVTLSGSQSATATTDASGNYSFTVKAEGNYTVTPSKQHYTFTPPSLTFNNLSGNQTTNFTATLNSYVISGRVTNAAGTPLAGVAVTLSGMQPGTATTDAAGNYSFPNLPAGGSYTVTLSRANYTFAPASLSFNNLGANQTANFTGALVRYTVSGKVTWNGAELGGVTVTLSRSEAGTAITDAAGNYSFTATAEGSYTITPSKTNYTFSPPSATFSNLGANQTADFSAALNRHRISGRVATANGTGIAGVVVMLSGSHSTTTTTDASGNYSFANLPAGGTSTVTPSRSNYSFTPASRTFDNLVADAAFDFTGALVNYRIGGRITGGSEGLGGVTVTLSGSQSSSATTDASGNYSFTVTAEGNYTVTPSKRHYTFAPQLISFNNLGGNQTADFSATLNRHTISGRVTTAGGGALPNVTLSLSGSQSGTVTSDAAGNFSFAGLPAGGSYTVTAARSNYAFTPDSKSFSDLGANQTADFTGGLVSYRISGRVISDGAGLAGVTINLSGSQTATAITDASGNYSFTVPAEGSYTVTASKTHYTFAPPSLSFNNLGGDQAADFAATLNRHTISGRVADANNKGIPGVTMALSGTQPRTATTNTTGNYSFADLPAGGSYTVTASKANYTFTPPSQSFNDLASGQTADFAATLVSYRISGRVTENGTGLGGVTVTLSGSQSATATTDVGGNYSFTVTAEGSYTVTPSKTNYTFSPPSVTFSNLGANQSVDFSASLNRHTISGSITTDDGGALPDVTVSLAGSQVDTATTDASGSYSFPSLPAGGSYTVTPSRANYTFTPATLSVSNLGANQAADFRAALVHYTVSGRVTLDGAGLGGVTVTLSGSETATATTDASGNYSFTVTAEGSYTVTPSKQHYTFTPQPVIFNNLGANRTADFAATLNRHTISGRVTGGGTGLGGVTVHLSGSQTGTVITDATGDYSFADLPAGGDYTVTPSRVNYTFSPASHSFGDLGASQAADFTGTPVSYTVSGRVTSGGSGLAGVTINLGGSQYAAAATDASGDYSFTVTAEGSYTVTPSEPHYTFTPPGASFSNLGADQRADFSATLNHHTISGRITRADGTGIAGVAVTLSGTQTGATTTDAAGNYSFTGLPAGGSYTVAAARTNYTFTPALSFSDLVANQTADFTGTPISYTISGRVVSGGIGLADIIVTLTGSETETATTDASGNYSFSVPAEGSYTVSPSEHYAFTPPSAAFDSLAANQTADFGAPPIRHRISGRLTNPVGDALPNVLLSLTGSQSRTTRTDEAGNYSFVDLPEGGNYTVTPRLFGYSFTPLSRTLNGLSADQTRDFAAGPVGGVRINLALPSDGPVFSVSTMYRLGRTPSAVINGDLRGIHWHDATPDGSPAWLEVSFAGLKSISEVHVFNIQENLAAIAEWAEATTFTQHGLQDFDVDYWTGADWESVPGGAVTNNSRVWVKIAFPPLTTTKIRLVVRRALGG